MAGASCRSLLPTRGVSWAVIRRSRKEKLNEEMGCTGREDLGCESRDQNIEAAERQQEQEQRLLTRDETRGKELNG